MKKYFLVLVFSIAFIYFCAPINASSTNEWQLMLDEHIVHFTKIDNEKQIVGHDDYELGYYLIEFTAQSEQIETFANTCTNMLEYVGGGKTGITRISIPNDLKYPRLNANEYHYLLMEKKVHILEGERAAQYNWQSSDDLNVYYCQNLPLESPPVCNLNWYRGQNDILADGFLFGIGADERFDERTLQFLTNRNGYYYLKIHGSSQDVLQQYYDYMLESFTSSEYFTIQEIPKNLIFPQNISVGLAYEKSVLVYFDHDDTDAQGFMSPQYGASTAIFYSFGYYVEALPLATDLVPDVNTKENIVECSVSVDESHSLSQIIQGITAVDDMDEEIEIVVENDEYTGNEDKIGNYQIILSASDFSGNKATLLTQINVVDNISPVITGQSYYAVDNSGLFSKGHIISHLTGVDNYDGDISSKIILKSDSYTANYRKIGVYQLVYNLIDSSGNETEYIVVVEVVDATPPIINGNHKYTKSTAANLTVDTITKNLRAYDAVDGVITSRITIKQDTYSSSMDKKGDYEIIYTIIDSSGNVTDFKVDVSVVDYLPPVFVLDDNFVHVSSTVLLSRKDIVDVLRSVHPNSYNMAYEIDMLDYERNYAEPGIYNLPYSAYSETGEEITGVVSIVVNEEGKLADYRSTIFITIIAITLCFITFGIALFIKKRITKRIK